MQNFIMYKWLDLILLLVLLCFVHQRETTPRSVTGRIGGSVTLSCESQAKEISDIVLSTLSRNIPVCEKEECKRENSRVFKEGSCDVIIKDLIYSDAGKYFLRVYYTNDQAKLERQTTEYHLHIHDEISVKKGEDLKLDVVLINADKVERNSRSGWTEVWRRGHGVRGHGVSSDRLTVSDQTLIIHNFTVTDTGTYRALDSNNETLITVTVTESKRTDEHKLDDTEQHNSWTLTVGLLMIVVPLALLLILSAIIMLYQHLRPEHCVL